MAESQVFETLVLELHDEERRRLLQQLQNGGVVSTEPLLVRNAAPVGKTDYAALFHELGFFTRIMIIIRGIVTNSSREDLIRDHLIKDILRKLETQGAGLVDIHRRILLESFWQELVKLRASARYFYNLLDKTLEKRKTAFFAFLASLEIDAVHNALTAETDPWLVFENNPGSTETDVRTLVIRAMEAEFMHISEEQRRNIYQHVHSLYVLRKLTVFPFDKFLSTFQTLPGGSHELSFWAAADFLLELDSILGAFTVPPSIKLMEALLAFEFNDDYGSGSFDLDLAIKEELAKAEQALSGIRTFNARVPLDVLLQVAKEDPDVQSAPVAGGEDWFALFKVYWRERTEKQMQRWLGERRLSQLQYEIDSLLGGEPKSWFTYLSETGSEQIPPIRIAGALRFLASFFHQILIGEMNHVLKLILMEGEFYKRDNKTDFADSYGLLLQIGDLLKAYDARLAPEGELGQAYALAKADASPLTIKRRKIESTIQAAETEADTILQRILNAMNLLYFLLKGILIGDSRGKYDSLANLSRIDGRANKDFLKSVETAKDKLERAMAITNELARVAAMSDNSLDLSVQPGKPAGTEQ